MKKMLFMAVILSARIASGQEIATVTLVDLQQLLSEKSDNIHVVNFWATWCGPCVKELPLFEKVSAEGGSKVKVTLVSMDLDLDPNPEKVYKFVARKNIKSKVLLLDEPDPNSWIEKIDKKWTGALPATLVINQKTGKRIFVGRSLREGELEKYLADVQ